MWPLLLDRGQSLLMLRQILLAVLGGLVAVKHVPDFGVVHHVPINFVVESSRSPTSRSPSARVCFKTVKVTRQGYRQDRKQP